MKLRVRRKPVECHGQGLPADASLALSALRLLAVCHLLVSAAVIAWRLREPRIAGALLLMAGAGGCGAAWGRWTEDRDWLSLWGATWPPEPLVVRTAAEHAPLMLAGCWLLARARRQSDAAPTALP